MGSHGELLSYKSSEMQPVVWCSQYLNLVFVGWFVKMTCSLLGPGFQQ